MNRPGVPASPGFPNRDCRATRITENGKLAWCITKDASLCPYRLLNETKNICSHPDCEAIVKWTEEYEE
ncbi:MAG TPA: hypothetical protein VK815_18680 [Candidatus Acidoferrales bacterium]|jgi:hypothetical protein|nr:hypothetical protein [Candidatus Acidoferrales bacterium]